MEKIIIFFCLAILTVTTFAQTEPIYPVGLKVGDKAPDFTIKNAAGVTFNLNENLQNGPLVIVFYRGQWCPYCNRQLSSLNDSLQLIKDKGAQVVAISPETQENIGKTVSKTKAVFPVLHDEGMAVMKRYKVNFEVDEKTVKKYKGYGIDFDVTNGENGANLPVPATYIVGKDGFIKYVFFNTDYTKRPSVNELLDTL